MNGKKVFFVRNERNSLTEGPIWKGILLFAMPILLGGSLGCLAVIFKEK